MQFGIKCKVDGNVEIGLMPMQIEINGMVFDLIPSEDGLLKEISAIVQLNTTDGFISTITQSPITGNKLMVDYDKSICHNLLEMMQYLEASLSFTVGVKKVHWDEPEVLFIPENEDEVERFDVTSFQSNRWWPPDEKRNLSTDFFIDIVQKKDMYSDLVPIKLFFKEGVREFNDFRFVNAYYNFYFVLEDLYGEGKARNKQVEDNFKSNKFFCDIIQHMIDKNLKEKHFKDINNFLLEQNLPFNVDGIIELIVQVRGNIHHFSRKSTRRRGTPLNQMEFESMAYLLMGLANFSIIHAMKQAANDKGKDTI